MRKSKQILNDTNLRTLEVYNFYINFIINLSLSMFNLENSDNLIVRKDVFFKKILQYGSCAVIEDKIEKGLNALQYNVLNFHKHTGEPALIKCYNEYGYQVTTDKFVIVYDNLNRTCRYSDFIFYSETMTNLHRTLDVNMKTLRTPIMFKSDSNLKLSVENLKMQFNDYQEFITVKTDTFDNKIEKIKLNDTYDFDKLSGSIKEINKYLLEKIGIPVNLEKNERLVQGENALSAGVCMSVYDNLFKSRLQGIDEINKKFGTNFLLLKGDIYEQIYNII